MANRLGITKEELLRLYIRKKKSSAEIGGLLSCSEHKINYWLEKHVIPKRSISEAVYAKRNPKGDPFRVKVAKTLQDAQLFGLGLGLFWGEGNKKSKNDVRLGNTDPNLIRSFIWFLVERLGVRKDKLRFGLQIFSDMSKERAVRFWLTALKEFRVRSDQFFKVTVTPSRGAGTYREKTKTGVLTVYVGNTRLKRVLDRYIADVAQW